MDMFQYLYFRIQCIFLHALLRLYAFRPDVVFRTDLPINVSVICGLLCKEIQHIWLIGARRHPIDLVGIPQLINSPERL